MAVSRIVVPSVSNTGSIIVSATNPLTGYLSTTPLDAGVYSISCVSSTISTIYFLDANGEEIVKTSTVSGSTSVILDEDASSFAFNTNTGNNISITIEKTGTILSSSVAASLQTISNSGEYNPPGAGVFSILAIGGGGAGGAGSDGFIPQGGTSGPAGKGGGSGRIDYVLRAYLPGSPVPVTIGAGGTNSGSSGGTTEFGNIISAAGGTLNTGGSIGGNAGSSGGSDGSANSEPLPRLGFATAGAGGSGGTNSGNPGGGGGIYAAGGGGGTGFYIAGGGGGGGGGGVPGSPGSAGNSTGQTPPGGAGGAGRVYILSWQ